MTSDKPLLPCVAVGSLCSPLEVGANRAPAAAQDLSQLFKAAGCEVFELWSVDKPEKAVAAGRTMAENHVHAVALAAASWFEDYLVLDLLEEYSVPVLLWPLPGMETGSRPSTSWNSSSRASVPATLRCGRINWRCSTASQRTDLST
jgi:hypothetical protein